MTIATRKVRRRICGLMALIAGGAAFAASDVAIPGTATGALASRNPERTLSLASSWGSPRPKEKSMLRWTSRTTMQRPMPTLSFLALTAASVVLTGCGSSNTTEGDAPDPVTLRMAHIDGGSTLDPAVTWFTSRVKELSAGDLTIDVQYECCGREADMEAVLVESVAAGEFDLGWVGTRVFADLGVNDFQALTAPLLVDSYALQEAVIGSDLPSEMLDGLDALDVTGLAVLPGSLRKPLSTDRPLVSLADWRGITFHAFPSAANADAIAALGATATDVGFDARDQGLFDGSIQGVENSILFHADGQRVSTTPYGAVNVNLWPRISALLANPDTFSGLSDTQAGWLRQAAADVGGRTAELAGLDAGTLENSCAAGARYATASEADLAALFDALAPAYANLEADPSTRAFIAQIRELKQDIAAEDPLVIPDGCTGAAASPEFATDDPGVLNGAYRGPEWTVEELVDLGAPDEDARDAAGTFTFTFSDGRFTLSANHYQGDVFGCSGSYTVAGDRVMVRVVPGGDCGPGGQFFTATFTVSDDTLRFDDMENAHPTDILLFATEPWTRVD